MFYLLIVALVWMLPIGWIVSFCMCIYNKYPARLYFVEKSFERTIEMVQF